MNSSNYSSSYETRFSTERLKARQLMDDAKTPYLAKEGASAKEQSVHDSRRAATPVFAGGIVSNFGRL